jgi:acyl-CoA reductase-like NAD-dependent aldehyde dehydrogenase
MLLATGGPAVAHAAMTSGKRAVAAGPGNPPAVVDETADIEKAAVVGGGVAVVGLIAYLALRK